MFEPSGTATTEADASPASASPGVLAVVEAVQALATVDPVELPGAQALLDARVLLQATEQLRAVSLHRVGDVSSRQLHTLDGAATVGTWVEAQQTSLDRTEVALAGRMQTYPALAADLLAKRLSVTAGERVGRALASLRPHVDRPDGLIDGQDGAQVVTGVLVRGVRDLVCEARGGLADTDPLLVFLTTTLAEIAERPATELARLEAGFLVLARHLEPAQLPGALAQLVDAVLPVQLEQRAEAARAKRGLDVRLDGDGTGYDVRGKADLELGELLHTVITAEQAVDPDNPVDTEAWAQLRTDGWEPGDDVPTCGAPRSLRERRHDALKHALRRYLDSGVAGQRDKVALHLSVTVGLDTLHAAPGALPARGASGASLPLSLVRTWWCGSAATRFVLSLGRKVIEASHTERTLKAHERRAKHVETGGVCQGAGCCRGPGSGTRLIPHHADPWATSRTTSLADTVLLCEQTHDDLHQRGRTLRLKDGRWLSAAGWVDGPGRWERA